MTATQEEDTGSGWRKLAVLILAVAAIGLPINNLADYVLLVVVAVIVFGGAVSARPPARRDPDRYGMNPQRLSPVPPSILRSAVEKTKYTTPRQLSAGTCP
jgi:hypothetical protein